MRSIVLFATVAAICLTTVGCASYKREVIISIPASDVFVDRIVDVLAHQLLLEECVARQRLRQLVGFLGRALVGIFDFTVAAAPGIKGMIEHHGVSPTGSIQPRMSALVFAQARGRIAGLRRLQRVPLVAPTSRRTPRRTRRR